MNLRSDQILWPAAAPTQALAIPVQKDFSCDVLVLGAGISGALAAIALAERGVDVAIVDRRGVAQGSTAASTALVQYELDMPLVALSELVGQSRAQRAYRATRAALDELHSLIERYTVECEFRRSGSLLLANNEEAAEMFAIEARARRQIGIDVKQLDREELSHRFGIARAGALFSPDALELNSSLLAGGLIDAARRRGCHMYRADAKIDSLRPNAQTLLTADGCSIRCHDLVVASGYETLEMFAPIREHCTLKTTFALASEPIAPEDFWPGRPQLCESGENYLYARATSDNRVIVGGEDEPMLDEASRDALLAHKTARLIERFMELRPQTKIKPAMSWAGVFAETADSLPFIGEHASCPGVHFALGYGGNGITFGMLASQIIRDSILGLPNEHVDLFRLDRVRERISPCPQNSVAPRRLRAI